MQSLPGHIALSATAVAITFDPKEFMNHQSMNNPTITDPCIIQEVEIVKDEDWHTSCRLPPVKRMQKSTRMKLRAHAAMPHLVRDDIGWMPGSTD